MFFAILLSGGVFGNQSSVLQGISRSIGCLTPVAILVTIAESVLDFLL